MIKQIKNNLKELGFSENEIKVYIALTQLGESTAAQIAKKADLPRTTTISILEKLSQENFLTTHRYRGTMYYWVESPRTIKNIYENKVDMASALEGLLSNLYRTESDFPYAKYYDTKSSIKNFIEKVLVSLEKKSIIYTIDAPNMGNYDKIYSKDFSKTLVGLKNKKGIMTKTLIPCGTYKTIDPKKIKRQSIEVRELPQDIDFKASLWIIKDMLVLFSGKYPFIVAVKHGMIVQSMRSVWDYLWGVSGSREQGAGNS